MSMSSAGRRIVGAVLLSACAGSVTAPFVPSTVVLIGDSITAHFGPDLTVWFGPDAAHWVNAGAGGNTSDQILARISTAIPRGTKVAVLLVGINDILSGAGDGIGREALIPPGWSLGGNIQTIVADMQANGVTPILATILPLTELSTTPLPSFRNDKAAVVNAWLRAYGHRAGIPVLDYAVAFQLSDGYGNPALYNADGLHPNDAGRAVMATVAGPVLRQLGVLH